MAKRGQAAVAERIAQTRAALLFAILGFDTGNGTEFVNWRLVDYFGKRTAPLGFTARATTAKTSMRRWNRRTGLMCVN